ncbi:histone-like transcription factor CBF/NF-Y [Nitzschia inconspicua]|uniref:Histone-like transcription factor CBF/NF-Y n=1 Tax=Nitzschia inconspicua TaxID=303405 RepID=A0A9K3PV03_9STRA|nr:histone-like transcription factor CBF/NF-Y [Nitzschia inconspicua]
MDDESSKDTSVSKVDKEVEPDEGEGDDDMSHATGTTEHKDDDEGEDDEEEEEDDDIEDEDDDAKSSAVGEESTSHAPSTPESSTAPPPKKKARKKPAVPPNARRGRAPAVAGLTIPFRTVKKAMKLDPDNTIVQNEAAIMTTMAAELFLKKLALQSQKTCKTKERNTIRYEDIAEARSMDPSMAFLKLIFP